MQTSWNGDKTILQSIMDISSIILQNTNMCKNNDVYNTTEIQNIKNSISGISTNVQAIEGRDKYYYMLVKPTVAGGSLAFKDMPTIAKITNDENVEMGIFPCAYSDGGTNNVKFCIDGILEDDVAQIFNYDNEFDKSYKSVKNMNIPFIFELYYNNNNYHVNSNANDIAYSDTSMATLHQHYIRASAITNFDFTIDNSLPIKTFCTSKFFKTLRLKALYYNSYLIVVKTKGDINYVDDVTMNSVISTLDGTPNFQEDTTNSANFKHYNYNNGNKSTNIYLQENAIVIPPTLI